MKEIKLVQTFYDAVCSTYELEYCTNNQPFNSKCHSLKIIRKDKDAGLYPIKVNSHEMIEETVIEIVGGCEINAFISIFENKEMILNFIQTTIQHEMAYYE